MAKLRNPPTKPPPVDLQPYEGDVAELTLAIRQLLRQSGRIDVMARAEIGKLLRRVHSQLVERGRWTQWVDREVPFTPPSAYAYMQIHDFAASDPQRFQQVAPLGATKVYLLMRLPPKDIDRLFAKPEHRLPSGHTKSLEVMTLDELMELVAIMRGAKPAPANDQLVNAYRRRVHALVQAIDHLIEHHEHIPAHDLADLHDDLLHATHRLAITFSLDDD